MQTAPQVSGAKDNYPFPGEHPPLKPGRQLSGRPGFSLGEWLTSCLHFTYNIREVQRNVRLSTMWGEILLASLNWTVTVSVLSASHRYRSLQGYWLLMFHMKPYADCNTVKLLTVICFSIIVSPACIEWMTKAVSVSLHANKSSFVLSYVTMSRCRRFWRSPHLHWGPVRGTSRSVEEQQHVCVWEREEYMHLPACEHMNKRLCYGPLNQFT